MDFANSFDNYDFIKLGELKISSDTKIVILYARFMHNSGKPWTLEAHSHPFYELHFPLNGSCNLVLQNYKTLTLSTHNHILIYPNTNHKFTHFSDDFFRLSIAFDIQRNDDILIESDKYILETSDEMIEQQLCSMLDEYHVKHLGYKNVVNLYIQAALIEVLRSCPEVIHGDGDRPDTAQKTLNTTLQFIRNNISLNITTEDVARHVNLSSRQLNRIFESNMNMTISEFIRNERILRVREHLKKTNLSLHEIAILTGFNDEYILCKTFKKITGITPGKYRAKYKKKG
ncbi:MAG: AraC family transcriptional regulator [Clostridia bacterium]|nr:AraC family transcriptional regulator [Clostridia bacterium]